MNFKIGKIKTWNRFNFGVYCYFSLNFVKNTEESVRKVNFNSTRKIKAFLPGLLGNQLRFLCIFRQQSIWLGAMTLRTDPSILSVQNDPLILIAAGRNENVAYFSSLYYFLNQNTHSCHHWKTRKRFLPQSREDGWTYLRREEHYAPSGKVNCRKIRCKKKTIPPTFWWTQPQG